MHPPDATIYIVDDDAGFLTAIVRLIGAKGYVANGVRSIPALLSHCPLPSPSCVLADIVLSGESGLEIPAMLNAQQDNIPIIFMSATDDVDQIRAASEMGFQPCLKKPFEAEDLFVALEVALQQQDERSSSHLERK